MSDRRTTRIGGLLAQPAELLPEEIVVTSALVHHEHTFADAQQGRLFLTDKRLIFLPYRFSWRKHRHSWALNDIELAGRGYYPPALKIILIGFSIKLFYVQVNQQPHYFVDGFGSTAKWMRRLTSSGVPEGPRREFFT